MPRMVAVLLVLAFAWPAAAQEAGGLALAPGVGQGPTGLARPLPFVLPSIGAERHPVEPAGSTPPPPAQRRRRRRAIRFSA